MEGLEVYDFIRFIFIVLIISSMIISILLLSPSKRNKVINGFTLSITSILSIIVSGITLIIMGYIADGLGVGGDSFSTYMFLVIIGLSIFNVVIYNKKRSSSS
ncbi:MAG: hypothetical protein ACI35R_04825 [Bacillus sp. (in: firmicutes)]